MEFVVKNYKIFLKGLLTVFVIFGSLSLIGFIRINPTHILENLFIFSFWWLFFSFLIYKIPYFKKNKLVLYKMIGLLVLLVIAVVVDDYWRVPDNPITFPIVILFWLGVAYLVLPQFFKKYQTAILSVYGAILSYFLFFRMNGDYSARYHDQVVNLLLIPIPVLIVLWFYEQWRWLKTLQADKGKAELALLKNQINPHFFFNTLNNLYGLVVEKSEQAPEVVLKLSDMMRYTIYEGKEDFVSLADEVAYLENYIELHQIRYQKKVDISFRKQIAEDYSIAPLLFIILLENAFKHGVERMTEGAYVRLNLTAQFNRITFAIENNFDASPTRKPKGIGLDNLQKRLAHIYPNQHHLKIEEKDGTYKAQLTINNLKK